MSSEIQRRKQPRLSRGTLLAIVAVITLTLIACVLGVYFFLTKRPAAPKTEDKRSLSSMLPWNKEEVIHTVVPGNGVASSVLCRDSYTGQYSEEAARKVAAKAGDAELTNAQLQILYASAVNAYRTGNHAENPDYTQPLDWQLCPQGDGTLSWQHYFLEQAVRSWQKQQAIWNAAMQPQLITEEDYKALDYLHEEYIAKDLPVNDFLYADKECYKPNELHKAYLDQLPETINGLAVGAGYETLSDMLTAAYGEGVTEEDFLAAAELYNKAYMYFTEKNYDIDPDEETVEAYLSEHKEELSYEEGYSVDFRHVLLRPEGAEILADGSIEATEEQWTKMKWSVEQMLRSWERSFLTTCDRDASFARLANENSEDEGSRLNGGIYRNITPGMVNEKLDEWLFDETRQPGDADIVISEMGYHLIYLTRKNDNGMTAARAKLVREMEDEMVAGWMDGVQMTQDYSEVCLWTDTGVESVSLEQTLYPDVAHERFPLAMTYLQQDYMYIPYGASYVGRGGCGITTMAMLSTYMTDKIYTPAMLARTYPQYHDRNGTNGDIFLNVPAELGYFMEGPTSNLEDAVEALKKGQRVISLQIKGHFTRGGHYLLLQSYDEKEDTFVVRDSNVYNYGRLEGHKVDYFTRSNIRSGSSHFYIMQPKITRIPQCFRCGDTFTERAPESLIGAYQCEKCNNALERRSNYVDIMRG